MPHSIDSDTIAAASNSLQAETVHGVIQQVDVVQREVSVLADARPLLVDIPPGCPVMLRGERIKLRIIQPGDVVRMKVVRTSRAIAQRVEVAPVNPLPAVGKI